MFHAVETREALAEDPAGSGYEMEICEGLEEVAGEALTKPAERGHERVSVAQSAHLLSSTALPLSTRRTPSATSFGSS